MVNKITSIAYVQLALWFKSAINGQLALAYGLEILARQA